MQEVRERLAVIIAAMLGTPLAVALGDELKIDGHPIVVRALVETVIVVTFVWVATYVASRKRQE